VLGSDGFLKRSFCRPDQEDDNYYEAAAMAPIYSGTPRVTVHKPGNFVQMLAG
jgi:hypothetical protein